ncbi:DUF2993 domain-containing protein [Streptomyces sp. NBC_01525]|uniref:LmeA family phospholipid-binding protein n=1 Tax=Streptomyces sp. NBC_01525 TaxID=2903893 RepID=UPI003862E1EF
MRALKVLLMLVVVVGGLFVAADRVAVNLAEDKAAEKIRGSLGLSATPEVSIKGFPFLTQVAGRNLDEVDTELGDLKARADGRTLRVEKLKATFHDVRLSGDYSAIENAASATATATLSYPDLTQASGENVQVAYGGQKDGQGRVKISPSIPLLSSLEVTGSVTAHGDTLRLRADSIPTMCRLIPGCADKVREQTDHEWKLDQLPSHLKLDQVTAGPGGVKITATGTDVKLPG